MRSASKLLPSLAVLAILLGSMRGFGQNDQTRALERADTYLTSETAKGSFRGSVLVGIAGKNVFEKGYGLANEEWNARNTPTTKFRIASVTKQFTAASILLLQERHQLQVHDPIAKYLPDLPAAWQAITIHQLLTHTSGIPDYTSAPKMKQFNRTGATPQELIGLVANKPLDFSPGSKFSYTNTGYVLLGMIIEKVSGETYDAFLRGNIFQPLGMTNSGYDKAASILANRASGYERKDGQLSNADFIDMSIPFAAGGIYSTVEDLYRWSEALAGEKLLSAESHREMFEGYPETATTHAHYGVQGHYGYGVGMVKRSGRTLYYHGGGVNGFSTYIQYFPSERICIVVLSNDEHVETWRLGDRIASELLDHPVPATR